jgi:acyl-coenzyme A thioesterase PaaI-like protein
MTFWMWVKLPAAAFAGVRCRRLDAEGCATSVPYGWRSQNPFRSTYFAAQAMAAELSTGALVLLATADAGVPFSTLILDIQGSFGKKAVSTATFTCSGGAEVFRAVAEAKATGEARTVVLETVGVQEDGSEVSRFRFTWSVKAKRSGSP